MNFCYICILLEYNKIWILFMEYYLEDKFEYVLFLLSILMYILKKVFNCLIMEDKSER